MIETKTMRIYSEVLKASAAINAAIEQAPTAHDLVRELSQGGNIVMLGNLADTILVAREAAELLKQLNTAANQVHRFLQNFACALCSETDMTELIEAGGIQGDYASGKPAVSKAVAAFKRDKNPELYDRFCREALGITNAELIVSGAIEIHYVKFSQWLTEQVATGAVLPSVLDDCKQYTELNFTVRKLRPVLAE